MNRKSEITKSHNKSEQIRSQGNQCFIKKNFFDALVKYNESLCFAENGSDAMGLSYANRSAVYFELKFYNRSLKNIELARTNGYPHKNIVILDRRAEKCFQKINAGMEAEKSSDPFDFIALTYRSNSKNSSISDCLELKINEKFGRHVITNRDLKVGDVVAIDRPHFKIMKSDSRYDGCDDTNKYQRCAYCLKGNLLDLIPCETCSSTMFCSDQCSSEAKKAFHDYECPIIDTLLSSGVMQMSMRIFFQSLAMFDYAIGALENFFNENEGLSASIYDFDSTDSNDDVTARNNLILLLCLARNDNSYAGDSPEKLFKIHPKLSVLWNSNETFIRKFILRTLQTGDCNFHGISGWCAKRIANHVPQMIGIGCYPFMSLINHSCAPNVNRVYIDDKMYLLVERPINKGEQLFDCYKQTFYTQSKIDRQRILLSSYNFFCDCIACTTDFPLFNQLKSTNKAVLKAAEKAKRELTTLNRNQATMRFKDYSETIQNLHGKGFPSAEIVLLQECMLQCIATATTPMNVMS